MKLRKRVIVRRSFHADIVNANLFARLQIVVNDHPLRPDDRHLADFSRLQPAALDCRKPLVPKREGHVRHVFDKGRDVSIPLAVNGNREFLQNMEND